LRSGFGAADRLHNSLKGAKPYEELRGLLNLRKKNVIDIENTTALNFFS
jgi:hypothetical protein